MQNIKGKIKNSNIMTDTFDSVSDTVMQLSWKKLADEFQLKVLPNVYVIPPDTHNIYIGFDPIDVDDPQNTYVQPTELKRYNYREVVTAVEKVFKDKVKVSPNISVETSLIVAPDRWDRRLAMKYAKYAGNLDAVPFSLILHAGTANADQYKSLIPPKNALEIMRSNKTLKLLDLSNMLINLSITDPSHKSHNGLHFEEPNDLPTDFTQFKWYAADAKNRHRRNRYKTEESAVSSRSRSRSRARSIARARYPRHKKEKSALSSRSRSRSRARSIARARYSRHKKEKSALSSRSRSRSRARSIARARYSRGQFVNRGSITPRSSRSRNTSSRRSGRINSTGRKGQSKNVKRNYEKLMRKMRNIRTDYE